MLLGWLLDACFAAQTAGCQELISKEKNECARGRKKCCLGASVIVPLRFILSALGTAGRSSSKKIWVSPEIRRNCLWSGEAAASSIKPRSLEVLSPHVKEDCVGESP